MTDTRHARVVVASTRAAQGLAEDGTGPVIRDWLLRHRFLVPEPVVVADGRPVADAVGSALEARVQVVITTGGTGVSPTDRTVEAVGPLLDLPVPGIIEEIRRRGAVATPTALLTRGVAGFAGSTFLVTLPGSPGGVRDGLEVLDPLLEHMLAQHAGTGDHPTG